MLEPAVSSIVKSVAAGRDPRRGYPHAKIGTECSVTRNVVVGRDLPRQRKTPGSYSGGCSFSGGVAVVVRWAERADPSFYCRAVPRHSASTELYPARELPGLFEPRDMLVRVGYAIDRLQAFLVDEPKVSHRNSPC